MSRISLEQVRRIEAALKRRVPGKVIARLERINHKTVRVIRQGKHHLQRPLSEQTLDAVKYMPTMEEIEAACLAIRMERDRSGRRRSRWYPPGVTYRVGVKCA